MKVCIIWCNDISVVIWSDMLGDIHMWRSALCWHPYHGSSPEASILSGIGETQ